MHQLPQKVIGPQHLMIYAQLLQTISKHAEAEVLGRASYGAKALIHCNVSHAAFTVHLQSTKGESSESQGAEAGQVRAPTMAAALKILHDDLQLVAAWGLFSSDTGWSLQDKSSIPVAR